MNVYKWRAVQYPVDAETAYHELERIRTVYGELTPENIELSARDKDSPIHECFEWDDTKAAVKYRRQQARVLTVSISVTTVDGSRATNPVNAFVHIEKEYKPINVVLSNDSYKTEMLENARKDMEIFIQKYRNLSELSKVVGVMEKTIREAC